MKRKEIQLLLKILSSLPDWTGKENYIFYRMDKSETKGNPSTSEVTRGSIVLYDQFFKSTNQESILVHKSGHHLFKKLSVVEVEEFATLSGWRMEATKDRKVFILPPEKPMKSDSTISKEEDFTNHLEIFHENENEYKKKYPKIFDFLKKKVFVMKNYLLIIVVLLTACSSQKIDSTKKHLMMGYLWESNATKTEVVRSLGNEFKEVQDGIIYSTNGLKSIQSGHFFKSDILIEQYIFLDEKSLKELKSQTPCNWTEKNKQESLGHTVYSVQSGECSQLRLSYKFLPGNNYYEVRWKK